MQLIFLQGYYITQFVWGAEGQWTGPFLGGVKTRLFRYRLQIALSFPEKGRNYFNAFKKAELEKFNILIKTIKKTNKHPKPLPDI